MPENTDDEDDLDDVGGVIGETVSDSMTDLELDMEDSEGESESETESEAEPTSEISASEEEDTREIVVVTGESDNLEGPFPEVLTIRVTEDHFEFMEGYVQFTDYDSPAEIIREFIDELYQDKGEEVERRLEKLQELQGDL